MMYFKRGEEGIMGNKSNAKNGIWLLIVNGEINKEFYNESEAISRFEDFTDERYEDYSEDVQLVRVLRTTKINEYKNLDTTGNWRISPSIEGL